MKRPLQDRINELKPEGASLHPEETPALVRNVYTLEVTATEKQLEHLKTHMRTIRIKFSMKEV